MAFKWKDFLELAKVLQSGLGVPVEAARRSAVSRAYYAAFCHTRDYAEEHLGFQRTKAGIVHKLLRQHLGQEGPSWKAIADRLHDLHEWRKLCDYEEEIGSDLSSMAQSAISTAEEVFRSLEDRGHAR